MNFGRTSSEVSTDGVGQVSDLTRSGHRPDLLSERGPVRRRLGEGGFALLLTITLLAFLVVLLVGLAAYMRVETAVAGNTQRQTQARQNALMALDVALGQLQKYAGPDQRVTATAEARPASERARSYATHYVGVWDTTQAAGTTPMTWLVSGNDGFNADHTPNPLKFLPTATLTTTGANPTAAELVGRNSTGTANSVIAPLVSVTAVGVPGNSTVPGPTIGKYAWWIGDQGVKAPVATADNSASINYAPWTSAELRNRLRQQVSLGAGAADGSGNVVFEPRDAVNSPLVTRQSVLAYNQIGFLHAANGAIVYADTKKPMLTNFHTWSPNNFNVIANTKLGGLRQDLSLDPTLLGSAFAAWANYDPANGGYMEDFTTPVAPIPTPALAPDPLRRRYTMQGGGALAIAPVLTYSLLSFNIRTQDGSTAVSPIQVRARWMFSLWNPYASSLVPENLRLEIVGLPAVRIDDETTSTSPAAFSLHAVYGSPLKVRLPWDSTVPSNTPGDDRQSWLPGRTYSWTALEDLTGVTPTEGYPTKFYSRGLSGDAGQGVQHGVPGGATIDGGDDGHIDGNSTALLITLIAERAGGDVTLATFTSPQFQSFHSASHKLSAGSYQFSYLFRLGESADTPATPEVWLTSPGRDPRESALGAEAFVAGPNGPQPEQYENYLTISAPDRLLDRASNSYTYNEDAPLFDLPRAPLLSLGALQHMALLGQRPFTIGNSWGADPAAPITLNGIPTSELFDRFFFSGVVAGVTPKILNASLLMPNSQMKALPRNPATGALLLATDLQGAPAAYSSKFLLQGAAFNVNSTSATAWAAVLRSTRFPAPESFSYLNADATTGTAADDATASVQSGDAQFFRFSHAAGETYKAEAGNSGGAANTHLFRQGMRTLTSGQVTALATAIAGAIATRHATSGPFRTMEEFLAPVATGSPSLLEQAIMDANINVDASGNPIEFSSQFLTQADILTTLAPVLFPRSDTFVIRTYGEAVNPTTGVTEGRAWCEATVQRVPEYFDRAADAEEVAPGALTSTLNQTLGRRFKIVSFRWLTRSDI